MASLKHLKWLIIPVFAVLLMSHNTYADSQLLDNYYLVKQTSGNPYCREINGEWFNLTWFNVGTAYRVKEMQCVDSDSSSSRIWANSGDIVVIELATTGWLEPYWYNTSARYLASSYDETPTNDIETIYFLTDGFNNSVEFSVYNESDEVIYYRPISINIYRRQGSAPDYNQALQEIKDAINNKSVPSAEDIADAVNEPEEQATENISNQSSDDYKMESANMTSLFSQFGNFISAVNGATIGDCTIPADFNHIDLGILDLCKNPVPDYVQVAVSIVSCMLIAPYLMNIIKRILSIADKIREV